MNKNALNKDNIYTVNGLVQVLGCNRLTIQRKINKYAFPITTIVHNNRSYAAYKIMPNELEKIEFEIEQAKKGINAPTVNVKRNKAKEDYAMRSEALTHNETDTNAETKTVSSDYTKEMLRNINELNTKIATLENENKSLLKENKDLTNEYTILLRDRDSIKNSQLLLEDKNKTIESDNARLTQENQQLNNTLNDTIQSKNKTITILSTILLMIVTVLATTSICMLLIKP